MDTLITNANIIDGRGQNWFGYLGIKEKYISEIGREQPDTGPWAEVIDAGGQMLLPGFIDCHVHLRSDGVPNPRAQVLSDSDSMSALRSARNAKQTIEAGITTIRDCGSKNFIDFSVRQAILQGLFVGPRMRLSGKIICMTGGHGWNVGHEADGVDGVRNAARLMLRAGADNIKLIATGGILTEGTEIGAPQYTVEEMRAGVEEAHKAGKIAAAHAHGRTGIKNAVLAGVDSIEHGYFLDQEGIDLMLERETFLVATSAAVRNVASASVAQGLLESVYRKASEAVEHHIENFGHAHKAGIKMAMGTDSGVPFTHHGNNLEELCHLVSMGMTPMEAVIASTYEAAKLLKMDNEIGSIEKGKLADLIMFDGDLLADVQLLRDKRRVTRVIQDGKTIITRPRVGAPL